MFDLEWIDDEFLVTGTVLKSNLSLWLLINSKRNEGEGRGWGGGGVGNERERGRECFCAPDQKRMQADYVCVKVMLLLMSAECSLTFEQQI